MGQEVVDGNFAFIVNQVGTSRTFDDTRAGGVFVIVSMAVRNVGTEARAFEMTAQKLKESDGRGHSASFMAPVVNNIDPGLQVSFKLAFDLPRGGRRTQLVLHESPSSPGAPVSLVVPPSGPATGSGSPTRLNRDWPRFAGKTLLGVAVGSDAWLC
ncbi:hypothetical protein GCM10009641_63270 [Mycobacterium cookii]|uniref:DUF4352 domain-containing protein n=1 Tax=Mycobacterium cookii TaxID=1775 RepID=A0A7I7KVJ0_9MYCO|nr:DUF4352 domain-containing protein [Mycobacterium cookii]MCV7330015.1 DUF4352 domain-containing protein [Mycobacterium cookii]BBX45943.1 hypothetical protein MCOO_19580 [Mycobacterium cookii]